jgi:tripartite ATP-independent transporter DctM subunit
MEAPSETYNAIESSDNAVDAEKYQQKSLRHLDAVVQIVLAVAIMAQVFILFGGVVSREFFGKSWPWSKELSKIVLSLIAFVGGALAYEKGTQISFRYFLDRISYRVRVKIEAGVDTVVFWISLGLGITSIPLMRANLTSYSAILHLPLALHLGPLPLGMFLMAIYALARMYNGRQAWTGIVISSILILGVFVSARLFLITLPGILLLTAMMCGLVLLLLGVPIAFVFIIISAVYVGYGHSVPIVEVGTNVANGITGFLLLPIPLFILAGYLMSEGGLSAQIIRFADACVRRLPGGLWQVTIVSTFLFSGLTGAKVADVAALGTTLSPQMRRRGYPAGETASVLASSAAMGETVPPSTAMIVLGSVTSVSIGSLFLGGVFPAVVTAILLGLAVAVRARTRGPARRDSARISFREICGSAITGIPALIVPVLLIGGIISGLATPTEISAVAVVYALIIVAIMSRGRTLPVLWTVVRDAVTMSGMVLLIVATATAVSWVVSVAAVPDLIVSLLDQMGGGLAPFWILSMAVLILAGAILEGLPAVILFGPIFIPIAEHLGIDPVHYGVLLVAAMGVGTFMPPIGLGSYVSAAVCDVPIATMVRSYIAYGSILILKIVLIAFIPFLTLWLPSVTGL